METDAILVWSLMHHSDDPNWKLGALTHYVDDSGGDQKAPLAVMGGPVFPRDAFLSLEREWTHALAFHRVCPPIHMKEFARPHGRLACLTEKQRRELFRDLVGTVNKRKLYGLTVAVDNDDFQNLFPHKKFKKHFTSAALAFLWCMILNRGIVKDHVDKIDKIAYFLSESPVDTQMTDCYNLFALLRTS